MAINNQNWSNSSSVMKLAMQLLNNKRERDNRLDIAERNNANALEIAKIQTQNNYQMNADRIEADLKLKQMGIDTDVIIQSMRNLNAKQIEEIRGNIQANLENLKNENMVGRIMVEFNNQLKLHNFDAKQAMRTVLVEQLAKLISSGKDIFQKFGNVTAWELASDIVDKTMAPFLDKIDADYNEAKPDLSNLGSVFSSTDKMPRATQGGVLNGKDGKKGQDGSPIKHEDVQNIKEEADLQAGRPVTSRPGQTKTRQKHVKRKGGVIKR